MAQPDVTGKRPPNAAASWLPDDDADEVQRVEVEWLDGKRESFWPESAESLAAEGKVKIVAADEGRLRAWREAIDARNRRDKPPTNTRAAFADVRPHFANRELYRTTTRRHLRDRPQYRRASRPGRPPGRRVARRLAASRDGPEPPPGRARPQLTELQQALLLAASGFEVARESDARVFDAFLEIQAIKVASETARRWEAEAA